MAKTKQTARSPPLNCTVIALYTPSREFQLSEDSAKAFFDSRGLKRPNVLRANEDWYLRQDYNVFKKVLGGYKWRNSMNDKTYSVPFVYMKNDVCVH